MKKECVSDMYNVYNSKERAERAKEDMIIKKYYESMTPDQYKEGIQNAIKMTEERCVKAYEKELIRITNNYNESIRNTTLIAMDTLATEMIYEIGRLLECYVKEPENLDQKIDLVQGIYETAMTSIEEYASHKYKNDKQAQKAFAKKKKTIQKLFGIDRKE